MEHFFLPPVWTVRPLLPTLTDIPEPELLLDEPEEPLEDDPLEDESPDVELDELPLDEDPELLDPDGAEPEAE